MGAVLILNESVKKNFVTSHATTCLMAFRLQAVCQPFEWLGHPFARNINPFELLRHPLIKNIKLFERLSHLFIEGVRPFERLGHPFAEDIRLFEQLGHPYNVMASLRIFCQMTWKTSKTIRSKYFTRSSSLLIPC